MDEKIGLRGVHYVAFREYCQLQALSVITGEEDDKN
jgi:hypothetical protein